MYAFRQLLVRFDKFFFCFSKLILLYDVDVPGPTSALADWEKNSTHGKNGGQQHRPAANVNINIAFLLKTNTVVFLCAA